MFCRYCGRQQKDDAEFCVNCGKLLHEKESETTESNRTDPITVEEPSQDATGPQKSESPEEEIWARIVGKNAKYYLPQFTKIKAGERGAFNWAAFFLGLPHAAYRGVWKAWLSFMKIPLIGMAAGYLLGYIGLSVQVMFLFGAGAVVCLAASVMQIVYLAYRYPKQFNRMYWNYVEKQAQQEVPSVGPFMGRVVAAMLILAVIGVASSTLSATALLSALAGDDFLMEDSGPYLTDPAPLQEETEASNNTSPSMREEIDYNELEHPTGFIVSYDGVDYTYDAPIKDELSDSKIQKVSGTR